MEFVETLPPFITTQGTDLLVAVTPSVVTTNVCHVNANATRATCTFTTSLHVTSQFPGWRLQVSQICFPLRRAQGKIERSFAITPCNHLCSLQICSLINYNPLISAGHFDGTVHNECEVLKFLKLILQNRVQYIWASLGANVRS